MPTQLLKASQQVRLVFELIESAGERLPRSSSEPARLILEPAGLPSKGRISAQTAKDVAVWQFSLALSHFPLSAIRPAR